MHPSTHTSLWSLLGSSSYKCFLLLSNFTAVNGFGKSHWYISINISKIYINCTDNNCQPLETLIFSCVGSYTCVTPSASHLSLSHLSLSFPFCSSLDLEGSRLSISFSVNEVYSDGVQAPPLFPPWASCFFLCQWIRFSSQCSAFMFCEDER